MSLKTYTGSCHCGAITFEADLDLSAGTIKCNCSSCTKARSWLAFAPANRYRLTAGASAQANYQWTPPGRPGPTIEFHFCKTCGIRVPARGEIEALGGTVYAIQVQLLDGVAPEELAQVPVQYMDGKHDHYDRAPAETRFL